MIDEDVVCFVHAIVVLVLVDRDAADRIELTGRIGVLHVAAQFDDEHAAVAVEGNLARLFDVGIGQDGLDLEPGRKPEFLLLLGRRQRDDWRLLREVWFRHRRATTATATTGRARCAGRRGWCLRRLSPRRRWLLG